MKIVYFLIALILLFVNAKEREEDAIEKSLEKMQIFGKENMPTISKNRETTSNEKLQNEKIKEINRADRKTNKKKTLVFSENDKSQTNDEREIRKADKNIKLVKKDSAKRDKAKIGKARKIKKNNEHGRKIEKEMRSSSSGTRARTCKLTKKCKMAKGKCIKKKDECLGQIISKGCHTPKHCKKTHVCCVHDPVIPEPEPEPEPVTCPACPVVTTTHCPTPGPIINPDRILHNVGSDWFIRISSPANWEEHRSTCKEMGLDLYQPKDMPAISKYLVDNFKTTRYQAHYVGARGNGTHQLWLSGEVVAIDNMWWPQWNEQFGTKDCLLFWYDTEEPQHIMANDNCGFNFRALCG